MTAWATGIERPATGVIVQGTGDLDELLGQLRSEQTNTRRYAARELRRQVLEAARIVDRGNPESLRHAEMRSQLYELQIRISPACQAEMQVQPDLVVPCSDMLGAFQDPETLDLLRGLAQDPHSRRAGRHLRAAIQRIERTNP